MQKLYRYYHSDGGRYVVADSFAEAEEMVKQDHGRFGFYASPKFLEVVSEHILLSGCRKCADAEGDSPLPEPK